MASRSGKTKEVSLIATAHGCRLTVKKKEKLVGEDCKAFSFNAFNTSFGLPQLLSALKNYQCHIGNFLN